MNCNNNNNNNCNNNCNCANNCQNNFCFSHIFEVENFLCNLRKTCKAIDLFNFLQNK